jgi:GABA(A) receptor-associated protein
MQTSLGTKLREKYPDRIPIIFEPKIDIDLSKTKMLISENCTVAQIITIIRKYVQLKKSEAMFLFVNGIIPPNTESVGSLYQKHKNDDGILEIVLTKENTFG